MARRTKRQERASILENLAFLGARLEKVEAEALQTNKTAKIGLKAKLKMEWSYSIEQQTDTLLVLSATCNAYFEPNSFFKCTAHYSAAYRLNRELPETVVHENIELLLIPCGRLNSLLVAELTDHMYGSPLVASPQVTVTR